VAHLSDRLKPRDSAASDCEPLPDKALAGDLYLACACARQVPQALSAFDSAYLSRVPAIVGHLDSSPAFLSEVAQAARVSLLLGSDGKHPAIGEYVPRAGLSSFVRIVVMRAALKLRHRRVTDGVMLHDPDGVDELPEPALGAELAHLKDRYRPAFKEALQEAVSSLSSDDRKQIATLCRVSEATMSRRLAEMRKTVLKRTQRLLKERLRLSPDEARSLAAVIYSQLDLSLSRILRTEPES
jgi:RNA polymerase sigma-70 factor (ECF subfamily)